MQYDEEKIIERIASGETLTAIAKELGKSRAALSDWLSAESSRSARAREARVKAAAAWDDKAEDVLSGAADPFELAKARELASHYRWRAKAVAPKEYGDKTQTEITGAEGAPLQVTVQYVSPKRADE